MCQALAIGGYKVAFALQELIQMLGDVLEGRQFLRLDMPNLEDFPRDVNCRVERRERRKVEWAVSP